MEVKSPPLCKGEGSLMHANPLHALMFTQETVTTGQIFNSRRPGKKKKKIAGVLCHSLRSINQKQTPSEKSPPAVIPTLQTMYFLLSFRNYKDKENKIPDATRLYLKTAAVQHLHNFNLVPN